MANVISWFEIPVSDLERAIQFYSKIFDVEIEESDIIGYPMAFFPNEGEGMTGALVYSENYEPAEEGTVVYFNANGQIDEILGRITAAGGKIVESKTSTEVTGHYAIFLDSEENKVGLYQKESV